VICKQCLKDNKKSWEQLVKLIYNYPLQVENPLQKEMCQTGSEIKMKFQHTLWNINQNKSAIISIYKMIEMVTYLP